MARKRSQPAAVAQQGPAGNTLAARADRLRRLVRERAQRDEQAVLAQGQETRREELRETVQVSGHLAAALALLRSAGIAVSLGQDALTQLRTRVAGLRRDFSGDPGSLARPHAFDRGEYHRVLSAAREALLAAWRQYVAPPEGEGVAGVLGRYEPFRPSAGRLREVQQSLAALARSLPQRPEEIERVRDLKDRAAAVLGELNLDAALLDLLTRAQTGGYPLQDVLESPHLVEQLRLTGLLACLRIVAA
jgi:hypothetical protein